MRNKAHRDHLGNCITCSYIDGKPGWYCKNCGLPLLRPQLPRMITIRNMRGKQPVHVLLTGTVKSGDKIYWPDGQVDVITL